MNSTLFFIRHYKPAPPFDDKAIVTEAQLVDLASGKADPGIHRDIEDFLDTLDCDFSQYEIILTSPAKRTRESAQSVKKHFNLDIEIQEESNIRECIWDKTKGEGRIKRFISGTGLSNIKDTWERFHKFESHIHKLPYNNILCFTHSFTMRNLYLYFVKGMKNHEAVTEEDIEGSFRAMYLDGFEVKVK